MVVVKEANLVLRLKVTERVNLEISEFFVLEVVYFGESEAFSRGGQFLKKTTLHFSGISI